MLEIQVAQFEVNPNRDKVINEIVNQLKTDSGSSLRDQTNRLEKSANDNAVALDNFRIALEAQKEVAEQDRTLNRHQAQNMIVKFDQLWTQMQSMLENQARVAAELAVANAKVEGVAVDLAQSHARADAVVKGPPDGKSGEAADAAAQSSATDDKILGD